MHRIKYTVAVVSSSAILQTGLVQVLSESPEFAVSRFNDLQAFQDYLIRNECNVVLIDSSIAVTLQSRINQISKENPDTKMILLVYQYVNNTITSQFHNIITIDQSPADIFSIIRTTAERDNDPAEADKSETLSDRETEVLKLLVTGFATKEIADKLNISVNTVITHRKNISGKTGIKSLAGLTIYAVTRKIISMNSISHS